MVLGHEGSGVVCSVGPGVTGLAVGDRVALEPGVPCSRCNICRVGRYNLCENVQFHATPPVHGCLARRVNHPAAFCYKLPENVDFDQAALLEPLSVALHAMTRSGARMGDRVYIAGSGAIGLMCVVAAKAVGVSEIVVGDIDPRRLQIAKKAGAHDVVDVRKNIVERRFEVCIDCSGAESAVRTCIKAAKNGGCVVLVGMGKPEINVPLLDAACREVDIRGVFRYVNTYQRALDLVASGLIDPRFIVTHRFPIEKALKAFETTRDSVETKAIKVIIECGNE